MHPLCSRTQDQPTPPGPARAEGAAGDSGASRAVGTGHAPGPPGPDIAATRARGAVSVDTWRRRWLGTSHRRSGDRSCRSAREQ